MMEPQEIYCCNERKTCKRIKCLSIVAIILLAAFTGILGVIIGAVISAAVLGALAAVIVLAIILGLLLILTIILLICNRCEKRC